jgi:hypothetical protein
LTGDIVAGVIDTLACFADLIRRTSGDIAVRWGFRSLVDNSAAVRGDRLICRFTSERRGTILPLTIEADLYTRATGIATGLF